jgi:hypothetical protein
VTRDQDLVAHLPGRLRAAGSTERSVLVDVAPKGQVEGNDRRPTCRETDPIRNVRVTAVRLQGVKIEYIKDDGKISQKNRRSTHKEERSDTASELVKLGNELGGRHDRCRPSKRGAS